LISARVSRCFVTLIAEAATAAFAGGLVFCLYAWLGFNIYLAFTLSGLVGWIGAKSIDMLGKAIVEHSGIKGLNGKNQDGMFENCNTGWK